MKKRGTHSTPKELEKNISLIEENQNVDRIIIGPARAGAYKGATGSLKFTRRIEGGIKLKGLTEKGIIDIFVYTKKIEEIINFIDKM